MSRSRQHFHGHVARERAAHAEAARANYTASLESSDEAVEWLAVTLRDAADKPDMALGDEREVWRQQLSTDGQSVTTGLQQGPTLIVVPVSDDRCFCERPNLKRVG